MEHFIHLFGILCQKACQMDLIEILWRRIKYQWIPFDAYLCFQNLKERLSFVLNNVGKQNEIIF